MAEKVWEKIEVIHCNHMGCEVALEAETVYPADHLPDQPARLLSHRCSKAAECMVLGKGACVWNGGNPNFDPFQK